MKHMIVNKKKTKVYIQIKWNTHTTNKSTRKKKQKKIHTTKHTHTPIIL